MRSLLLLIFILAVPAIAFPTTIYVPDDYTLIQDAIFAAANGDTILVRPGTYVTPTYGDKIGSLGKQIEVRSDLDGNPATRDLSPQTTIIDGNQFGATVVFCGGEGPSTVFAGFTITNGSVAGIYCYGSSPTIEGNIITGNQGFSGGGMSNEYGYPRITNCAFIENSAMDTGGGIYTMGGSPTITHCTFSGNFAGLAGGGIHISSGNPALRDCILWNEIPDEIFIESGSPSITFCCIQGGYPDMGNIDQDPLFVDGPRGSFYLSQTAAGQSADSPCVDAGNPASAMISGVTRADQVADQGVVDMGYHYPEPAVILVPWDVPVIQDAIDLALDGDVVLVAPGTYVTAVYGDKIDFCGKSIEVRSDVDGDPDTRDPSPETTIIDGNQLGAVVCFQGGEKASSVLEGFTLTNGFVSGPYGGGIYCYQASPTISNNIITGNYAYSGGGMGIEYGHPTIVDCTFKGNSAANHGGGLYSFNFSNPKISRCAFINNAGWVGGGIAFASGEPIITNCTFTGNSAGNSGGAIKSACPSGLLITHCTFSGNSAGFHGGSLFNSFSNTTLTHCILWGGFPEEILVEASTTTIEFSCIQGGFVGTGNIDQDPLLIDPLNGDCHLSPDSPCIDAGDRQAPSLPSSDFEGDPRKFAGNGTGLYPVGSRQPQPIVDMGADEFCLLKRKKVTLK